MINTAEYGDIFRSRSLDLARDSGQRQLTDLIFEQYLTIALSFFDIKDSVEFRVFYEFQSAGMAAFILCKHETGTLASRLRKK